MEKSASKTIKNEQIKAENQLKTDELLKNKIKLRAFTIIVVKDKVFF